MFCDAQSGKCKDTEKVWGLISIDPETKKEKLHRLTFSQSLAMMIEQKYPPYKIKRLKFKIGNPLSKGEISSSGLYAIMSKKGDYALRISLIKESAEIYAEDSSRYLAEAWIEP